MLTTEEIKRVKKIQNSQYSLGWGSSALSDTEVLFVVGHSSYKKDIWCFTITDDYEVYIVDNDSHKVLAKQANSISDCIVNGIIPLLRHWFPPIGLKDCADDTERGGLASAT